MKKTIEIGNLYPTIADGSFPVKREVDRPLRATVEVCGPGRKKVELLWREKEKAPGNWNRVPMKRVSPIRWEGEIPIRRCGTYLFTAEASVPGSKPERYGLEQELWVGTERSRFAAWYELFPRSQGTVPGRHGTFKDVERRLPEIKAMGFDVIYVPPVCPIGHTNRKGRNNSLVAAPDDPGTPWSVGNEHGGHTAIHPLLGTEKSFRHLVSLLKDMEMELALDFTSNCSPDHPWIREHPGWFFRNPDGTIKYAENPPKKYEDVCPLNYYPKDREAMWQAQLDIFLCWIERGVTTFRIDNPHTKPTEFWAWLIREIRKVCPEAVFLSEAFTDYDKLEELARAGFTQSYSYFTWRNGKNELIEYFLKLTGTYLSEFLRVNLFTNTPDILPEYLQTGGKPAFKIRAALAATLSSVYGIYSGFELLENKPLVPGKESYLDSEKYEIKVRDWDRAGNIKDYLAALNRIRRENRALRYYDNLRILSSTDDQILFYGKISPGRDNIVVCAVNLDPFASHTGRITLPLEEFGIGSNEEYRAVNLLDGVPEPWRGREQIVTLDPEVEPAAIYRIEKPAP
nr:DUF3416 domain-containing protein [bacterium]